MSANASATHRPLTWSSDPRAVRTFRYALGSTLAMGLAMGVDWRLSYLTPVLALSFLGSPAPRPTLKMAIGFVGVVAITSFVGVTFSALLLPYPEVFLLLEGLIVYHLFYAGARGVQPLLVTLLLIAVTVIPVAALQAMPAATAVAKGLVYGAIGAVSVVWLAHVLVPDPVPPALPSDSDSRSAEPAGAPKPALPSRQEAAAWAWLNTIVVYPVVLLYLVSGMTSVLVLLFVAMLSMQPDFGAGRKAGKAMIVGNVMGGVAAVVGYELLVMVPQFGFLLLLTLLAGLFFGGKLFAGAATAPLFGMAYSTMLLVVGSTTSSVGGDAGGKVWTRVIQITIAVLYVVVAFGLIQRLRSKPEVAHATT